MSSLRSAGLVTPEPVGLWENDQFRSPSSRPARWLLSVMTYTRRTPSRHRTVDGCIERRRSKGPGWAYFQPSSARDINLFRITRLSAARSTVANLMRCP